MHCREDPSTAKIRLVSSQRGLKVNNPRARSRRKRRHRGLDLRDLLLFSAIFPQSRNDTTFATVLREETTTSSIATLYRFFPILMITHHSPLFAPRNLYSFSELFFRSDCADLQT
jgi:hypothetical protein